MRAAIAAVLVLGALAGCGGGSSDPADTTPADRPDVPQEYADRMQPLVAELGRLLRAADLRVNRRDFDRGLRLLEVRKRMDGIAADAALLVAHDRLAQAVARAGTLLVANPGSPLARAGATRGLPPGSITGVAIVGPALAEWSAETAAKFASAGAPVPAWIEREGASARRLGRRARGLLR